MVRALEEIHRLLRPEGGLIDIHPVHEAPLIEVVKGGKIQFAEPVPAHDDEDYRHADAAVAQIVQRGLFVIERSGMFDFLTYASSIAELRAYMEDTNAYEQSPKGEVAAAQEAELAARVDEVMRVAGKGAEVAHHEKARIVRLRPTKVSF